MRFRNWCFTSYKNVAPTTDIKGLTYMIYQLEECPTTKKLHYQGYMEFDDKITLNSLKKKMGDNEIHLEQRKGTQQQAIEYCKKSNTKVPGTEFEYGKPKRQGHDGALDEIAEDIKEGLTQKELFIKYDGKYIRHSAQIRRTIQVFHDLDELDRIILERRENKICKKELLKKGENIDFLWENADILNNTEIMPRSS